MEIRLGMMEARFAEIVWANEPIDMRVLLGICAQELNWKRTTTYTVLKRLCERGILQFNDRIVTSKISKSEFFAIQSEQFVDYNFAGSLPAFLAAFTTRKTLTAQEVSELKKLVDSYGEKQV